MHKTIKFATLRQLTCFVFLLKIIEMLWIYENVRKLKLEVDWAKPGPKMCLLRN